MSIFSVGGLSVLLLCQGVSGVSSASAASSVSQKPQCQAGVPMCVHHVLQEMNQRFRKLERSCDHDAIFALVYLRTTEKYLETLSDINYSDPSSVTREDALFADYYFRAFDAYHTGHGDVPPVWQVAFDAAKNHELTAAGNAFLGINAHIQRDLPFVLYELDRRGTPVSYADHNRVNQFLVQVDVASEIIAEFDPTYPPGADASLIIAWREGAWQNYQRLKQAGTSAEREAVAASIEAAAVGAAQYFASITAYTLGATSAQRDAFCAAH